MDININEEKQIRSIQNYYKIQSRIYDATRWSFLFGRNNILKHLPIESGVPAHIAEVGCGTGKNLSAICLKYPNVHITGIDVSESMIERAERKINRYDERINLLNTPYTKGKSLFPTKLDGILFSYSLTMINPHWNDLLDQAYEDLKSGGFIAVVDFHISTKPWFKQHMSNHHVRMDGHILPHLQERYTCHYEKIATVYASTWQYFQYIGIKP